MSTFCADCGGNDETPQEHCMDCERGPATNDQIRRIFMDHGFTIKPGCDDLKPYVYAAARALIDEVLEQHDETVIYGSGFADGYDKGRSDGWGAAMQQVEEQRGDALFVPRDVLLNLLAGSESHDCGGGSGECPVCMAEDVAADLLA